MCFVRCRLIEGLEYKLVLSAQNVVLCIIFYHKGVWLSSEALIGWSIGRGRWGDGVKGWSPLRLDLL